jgi:hypothetical protein
MTAHPKSQGTTVCDELSGGVGESKRTRFSEVRLARGRCDLVRLEVGVDDSCDRDFKA